MKSQMYTCVVDAPGPTRYKLVFFFKKNKINLFIYLFFNNLASITLKILLITHNYSYEFWSGPWIFLILTPYLIHTQPESSRNREIPIIKLKQSVRKSHWLLVPSRLHEPESKNFS